MTARHTRSSLKQRIASGNLVLGAFVFLPSAAVVEILAESGFDFVIIDQEHSPKNVETVEHMVRAAEARGISALVRVHRNDASAILHAIESGADGVVIPFIRGAEDVRQAVAALHYPPRGVRGLCTQTRAAHYGALRSEFFAHAARRAEEMVMLGLIEDPQGVANIEEILAVENSLDAVLVGRGDLAATMGKLGQTDDPAVRDAVHCVFKAVADAPAGSPRGAMTVFGAEECAAWQSLGCNVMVAASEASLFVNAGRAWTGRTRSG